jgi:hypothetical protein
MSLAIKPFEYDLTFARLTGSGFEPLFAGDTWEPRFQAIRVKPSGEEEPISLTGGGLVIKMTVKRRPEDADADAVLTRRSTVVMADAVSHQIDPDADQSQEQVDSDGLEIGTGWFTVRFRPEDAALLAANIGFFHGEIVIKQADGTTFTFWRGRFEICRRLTETP